ncbi:signal peptidase I [Colwellia sp. M166]|mgnify:FL=1|uniref:signal peptidase I n=1 Tax=Colwellia sp. M166 TaxID=2583805 RepID=UPI00211DD727|nr:signal peptidase I [Colwellia sp. M166]UUO22541.1 signal peptidase I [Colwellia sp. M166]
MKNTILSFVKTNTSLLVFISLMLVFRSAVADWNDVPTGSMKPTIVEGDRILINKMAYDLKLPFSQKTLVNFADPKRNDIVIFESEAAKKRLVKRVIGIPGDTVSMVNNQLSINHQVADYTIVSRKKNYTLSQESIAGNTHLIRTKVQPGNANQPRRANFREITIPAGFYLMMGDNRDNSADSRSIGLVPREEIIGRSNKVVFSLNYEQYLVPRSERFLKAI